MFKIKSQLTNVRPTKNESPELTTTPTPGNLKINAPAAKLLNVGVGEYLTIITAETENGLGSFLTKGNKGNDDVKQVGSILSSTSENGGGNLQFGSTNAWNELNGNKNVKKVYSISSTPIEFDGVNYFEITFNRDEEKAERKTKAILGTSETSEPQSAE